MLLSGYDQVVCITTDSRYREHRSRIRDLLREHGVNLDRVSFFVNGKGHLLPEKWYQQIISEADLPHGWSYSYGYYAVSRAFRSIIQSAFSSGVGYLLVVEDDCSFVPDFDSILHTVNLQMDNLPPWDILYYGANHTWAEVKEISSNVLRCKNSFMTHCIGIRRSVMEELVGLPIVSAFDITLASRVQSYRRCYAIWPSIAVQLPGYSCIDNCYKDLTGCFQSKGHPWEEGVGKSGPGGLDFAR